MIISGQNHFSTLRRPNFSHHLNWPIFENDQKTKWNNFFDSFKNDDLEFRWDLIIAFECKI